eukprot:CAMPEP_0204575928 /NCGR_PEP_ID=MMETSP0661-20131031/41478_1 /ASSEMBLY_ACC=CAM_ASM_000606 /TAXON_ID=109239 /ORGANISM="Alexandrium margalefi, Strain AMGDE01CS-322" /LENGTH=323 /DNA_ID=CAMNT_0051584617 /DNA_START=39 /DNA_END=1007 /DNA_ORIENTATION=+
MAATPRPRPAMSQVLDKLLVARRKPVPDLPDLVLPPQHPDQLQKDLVASPAARVDVALGSRPVADAEVLPDGLVVHYKPRAVPRDRPHDAVGRRDHQRGAGHDEEVGRGQLGPGEVEELAWQRGAKEHGRGLHCRPAAPGARYVRRLLGCPRVNAVYVLDLGPNLCAEPVQGHLLTARLASHPANAAMDVADPLAGDAGVVVQPVDVLREHTREQPLIVQELDEPMRERGLPPLLLCAKDEGPPHLHVGELVAQEQLPLDHPGRVPAHQRPLLLRRGEQLRPQAAVHAAGRAEVRDARARGDAGAGEHHDRSAGAGPQVLGHA